MPAFNVRCPHCQKEGKANFAGQAEVVQINCPHCGHRTVDATLWTPHCGQASKFLARPASAAARHLAAGWQLESDATKASSRSTALASDIGTGTMCGEEDALISAHPSNAQRRRE